MEMKNPLGKSNMFATPESVKALQDYAAQFSGTDAVVAMTLMGMTWNLCSDLVAAKIAEMEAEEA